MTNIVFLFSLPRSGSHVFGDLVGKNPAVVVIPEAFHSELFEQENNLFWFILKNAKEPRDVVKNIHKPEIFFAYIDYLTEKYPKRSVIIDIKVHSFHHLNGNFFSPVSRPRLLNLVAKLDSKIIYLKRPKLARLYFSQQLATHRGKWHFIEGQKALPAAEYLTIDPCSAINEIVTLRRERDFLERILAGRPKSSVLEIAYDSVVDPEGRQMPQTTAQKIADFLNVPSDFAGETIFRRTTSDDVRTFIQNYDEIADALVAAGLDEELP